MATFIRGDLPREEAIRLLTRQDVSIRAFASSWPAPRWIKLWEDGEPEPRMAWINGAYATWYALEPHEYIGKPDSTIWPPEVCARFRALDLEAIDRAGEIVSRSEPTPRGWNHSAIARKFAARVDSDGVHGWIIYGEICPLDIQHCDTCPHKGENGA